MLATTLSQIFPAVNYAINVPPYEFGGYDTIATDRGRKFGRAKSFSLGISFGNRNEPNYKFLKATYVNNQGQPRLSRILGETNAIKATFNFLGDQLTAKFELKELKGDTELPLEVDISATIPQEWISTSVLFQVVASTISESLSKQTLKDGSRVQGPIMNGLFNLFMHQFGNPPGMMPFESAISLAPVRTRPKRIYDESSDEFRPEGDHIPRVLARIFGDENIEKKTALHNTLIEFGRESGLFRDLKVSKIGKQLTGPFRIMVHNAGPYATLQDVGYGVSQSLPIIVESALAAKHRTMLVQQPEVHLHPRAQAALGTFIAKIAAKDKRRFVIETHSDFLVDRIRREIGKGTLASEDVSILFFDKSATKTKVHILNLDKFGNILNAPKTYRKFFLHEEQNLLSRA